MLTPRQVSTEPHTNELGRELPPVGSSESNELGQRNNSEFQFTDQTIPSTAPRDIAERSEKPLEPHKPSQATQASLQPDNQAVAAKQKELVQQKELLTEFPEQEAIRAKIEAVKRMVSEVYTNEPEKLKKMLRAIDDKTPDIMSGEVALPPIKIETVPERVAVKNAKPDKDQDMER